MSGQQHIGEAHQVMQLTEASLEGRRKHQMQMLELEAKKIASTIDVPTLQQEVRDALRAIGQPVRLFGENLADIRQRLRMELAKRQLGATAQLDYTAIEKETKVEQEEEITKYTRASHELVQARQKFAKYSIEKAHNRLERERRLKDMANRKRKLDEECEIDVLDKTFTKLTTRYEKMALAGSQYGDDRALSCVVAGNVDGIDFVTTSSWTGSIHCWDVSSGAIEKVAQKTTCHEDRIVDLAQMQTSDKTILASASIDKTAKLWHAQIDDDAMKEDADETKLKLVELQHLRGHGARLSQVVFHPMQEHLATTSYDYSWRLWDIETGQELLLQDGHYKEAYGIDFHPDGSLCATSDFSGVIQLWDLRSGKSIKHFTGHAKRVLHTAFHKNGFQLATAGDDGTIKLWDLRKRKQVVSVPAHNRLVSSLKFHETGELLTSTSFDGTAKVWSTRDWKMIANLQGHEGCVTQADYLNERLITCGWDRTLKLWR